MERKWRTNEERHYGAIATTQPVAVHNHIGMTALLMWSKLQYIVKLDTKVVFFKRTFEGIFESDFVISNCISMFRIARNHPKKYHLCQKHDKSGICKCVLAAPSSGLV